MTFCFIRAIISNVDAGWSSLEARRAHNPKVTGSNPVPATKSIVTEPVESAAVFFCNGNEENGCGTVQITASDMGVKLYTDFGFEHNGNFMQYKL